MSTISLYHGLSLEVGPKSEVKTRSIVSGDNYRAIIGVTGLFFGVALVFTLFIPIMVSPEGSTMDEVSACKQKIIEFQRLGYYSNQEQFRLALSYCYIIPR